MQDSLFRAYRAFKQFRGQDAKGWLLTIVRHSCYHQLKRKRAGFPRLRLMNFCTAKASIRKWRILAEARAWPKV